MLETLDLRLNIKKKEYDEDMERLGYELQVLQRMAFENRVPVLINFEGWDASGKGDSIACLVQNMDPRGFRVFLTRDPTAEDSFFPFLLPFWLRIPGEGEVAIFDRSYYYSLYTARLNERLSQMDWERLLQEVKNFERQLTDGGTTILNFWLHISKNEQKKRMTVWEKDKTQSWRVTKRDWANHKRYKEVLGFAEEMLALTHTHQAPWILVEAENERFRRVKVLSEVVAAFRKALENRGVDSAQVDALLALDPDKVEDEVDESLENPVHHKDPLKKPPAIPIDSPLARVDLSLKLGKKEYKKRVDDAQERLRDLGFLLYKSRRPAVIVFEGWDAGGKGGAIKRITRRLDPRGYAVIPISAPKGDEATHHYLWRFWRHLPKDGHIAIFDRSWYGRVMVERVEGFCSEAEWLRAYQEINEFEYSIARHGAVILKFWLHISPEEQLRRFVRRERISFKRYKITDEDWRNRAKWPAYLEAVSDMLRQTSTPYAPWTIVEANDKPYARVKVLETTVAALEAALDSTS